jgi:hypothetical protein
VIRGDKYPVGVRVPGVAATSSCWGVVLVRGSVAEVTLGSMGFGLYPGAVQKVLASSSAAMAGMCGTLVWSSR